MTGEPPTYLDRAESLIRQARTLSGSLRSWNAGLFPGIEKAVRQLAEAVSDLATAAETLARHVRAGDETSND